MMKCTHVAWMLVAAMALVGFCSATAHAADTQPAAKPALEPELGKSDQAPSAQTAKPGAGGAEVVGARDANGATTQPAATPPQSPFSGPFLYVMVGALALMFILSGRSKKKQENQKKQMLSSMKKGDRVTTIGGIIGTVIEARENEVVVKVDETNNVRMRFIRSAIHSVGEPSKADEKK